MRKFLIVAAFVLGLSAQPARASIVSIAPTWAAQSFIAAPPSGSQVIVKSLTASADANAACVYLYSGASINSSPSNLKFALCAPAQTTVSWPPVSSMQQPGFGGAAAAFLGELLTFSTRVSINTGVVDSSKLMGLTVASYVFQALR